MKILTSFKRLLNEVGRLKRAWFTSFNLSPAFIEGYILPLIAGVEEKPKSARDFELIQKRLNEEEIDVRFFCDGRVAELNEGKKTSVPIHLINPAVLGAEYSHGVFHPKVVLLQNEYDEIWMMTGSANLTVGGWAHNRECCFCDRVAKEDNLIALTGFYSVLFEAAGENFPSDFSVRPDPDGDDGFDFISSLTHRTDAGSGFMQNLLTGTEKNLTIWSPYFSEPLQELIKNEIIPKMSPDGIITIIPDLSEHRIRLTEENGFLENIGTGIQLCRFDYGADDAGGDRLDHAKLWCTEERCAVGSWNLTYSAIGVDINTSQNIEAGVIVPMSATLFSYISEQCKPLENIEYMDSTELEDEKPDFTLNPMGLDIRVTFDWVIRQYAVTVNNRELSSGLSIILPDIDAHPLKQKNINIANPRPERLMKDHFFYIRKDEKSIQTGIIVEINAAYRPVWQFTSLNELLFSYIEERSNNEKQSISYSRLLGEISEEGEYWSPLSHDFRFSYFSMFKAFHSIRRRVRTAMENYENNPRVLIGYLTSWPGSLFEIADKIASEVDLNAPFQSVFNWFLIQETNSLLVETAVFLDSADPERWKDIIYSLTEKVMPVPGVQDDKKVKKYLEHIIRDSGFLSDKEVKKKIRGLMHEK